MNHTPISKLCGWLVVLLVSSSLAWTQTPPSSFPGVFTEVLDVRVVNLEVVVTEKSGIPVRGLRPEDFTLTIDGEEVPIEYFSEIRGGVAAPLGAEEQEMGIAELPAVIAGEPVETSYLVFIDEFFGIARDRDKVLESLQEQVARLGPKDRMAIVAYDGEELAMLTTWSQSVPGLERTIEKAMERPVFGLRRLAEQRQYDYDRLLQAAFDIQTGNLDAARFFQTDLRPDERYFLEKLTAQVQSSISAATMTLRSFAKPPGRKVMLLYSGGWPFFPVSFLGPLVSPIVQVGETERGPALFRPLSDTANLLGYTIYPVDMPGFDDLMAQGLDRGAASRDPIPVEAESYRFRREQEIHYSLSFLAEETGGRAFLNEERLTAFDQTVSDTRSFYWLGFTPQRDWDDRRHKVEIKVGETRFRLRSRASYLDSSRQHEVAMALESQLLFGSPAGTDLLKVELGEPRKSGRKRMEIPISVLFPLSEVTFLAEGSDRVTNLELRVALQDDEGRRAEIPVVPLLVRIDSDPSSGAWGRFNTTLRLRRIPHQGVVGVFDPASGRILSTAIEISP